MAARTGVRREQGKLIEGDRHPLTPSPSSLGKERTPAAWERRRKGRDRMRRERRRLVEESGCMKQ